MAVQYNTHAKLLATDFLSLPPQSLTRTETLGVVTSLARKHSKHLIFTVDDATGNIPCILWLNHRTAPYFSRRPPQDVDVIADVAERFADSVRLGEVVRVRGRVGVFRGVKQVTVTDVAVERDPNAEILHWLECIRLRRRRRFADLVRLGEVVRVRGRVGVFRGVKQVTVTNVVVEGDPYAEILHWLECINRQ